MQNDNQKVNPTAHFAGNTILKIIKIGLVVFIGFNALIFLLLGSVFTFGSLGTITYDGEAEGTVVAIQELPSENGERYCTYSYKFDIENKPYSGKTSVANPDSCIFSPGTTVNVKYDPEKPTNNSAENAVSVYAGIAMLIIGIVLLIGVVIGIVINSLAARHEDRNNDGYIDDNMPANAAQISLIQNGMRDLGEFWMPQKMTQHEAREMIDSINKKLTERK